MGISGIHAVHRVHHVHGVHPHATPTPDTHSPPRSPLPPRSVCCAAVPWDLWGW
jgi:hypothetical protein